jgi:hypothetical protein
MGDFLRKNSMGRFVLLLQTFRGQVVIRFGSTTTFYHLIIKPPSGALLHFILKDDITRAGSSLAFLKRKPFTKVTTLDRERVSPFSLQGKVQLLPEPGQAGSANPTKNTPAWLERLDSGEVVILSDSPTFKKFEFKGKRLQRGWIAVPEKPGSEFWEIKKASPPMAKEVRLFKADDEKRIVWGVVLEPDEVDAQGHTISEAEIAEALHFYMLQSQRYDEQHARLVEQKEAMPVEVFQAPTDISWPVGDSVIDVKKGSWVQATKVLSADLWKKIKGGELSAYSIRGFGKIRELQEAEGANQKANSA